MDPERVRAYLQVACAGLGFDIGEIWWTSTEHGHSTLAAIHEGGEEPHNDTTTEGSGNGGSNTTDKEQQQQRKLRFVQLYTSKNYENRRGDLLNPPESFSDYDDELLNDNDVDDVEVHTGSNGGEDDDDDDSSVKNVDALVKVSDKHDDEQNNNVSKHVLSPRLVDAIANTTQVVWANTKKREGLIGRSDIRLQTAVGMPVAVDNNGNMCVVVMFSPNNLESTDDAMEYLQSISHSATSSQIPCLMPAFDHATTKQLTQGTADEDNNDEDDGNAYHEPHPYHPNHAHHHHVAQPFPNPDSLGEGVTARFVSLEGQDEDDNGLAHGVHDLSSAPKDTFGIPMLPSFAELGGAGGEVTPEDDANINAGANDVFDEASYGIWTTIMERPTTTDDDAAAVFQFDNANDVNANNSFGQQNVVPLPTAAAAAGGTTTQMTTSTSDPALHVVWPPEAQANRFFDENRRNRLEEFLHAFLDLSVFDLADVWVPVTSNNNNTNTCYNDCLRHVLSCTGSDENLNLTDFQSESESTLIKFWTGAVGRAYSSGNPVWSTNPQVFVDPGRASSFDETKIRTVLAVPVFSSPSLSNNNKSNSLLPECVVSCYSLVRSASVPFVLRFVQQALRLLWEGLENVRPQKSIVDRNVWDVVAPADLGEMAADVEMQHHFVTKTKQSKRPYALMSDVDYQRNSLRYLGGVGGEEDDDVELEDEETAELSSHLQTISLPNGDTVTIPLDLEGAGAMALNEAAPPPQPPAPAVAPVVAAAPVAPPPPPPHQPVPMTRVQNHVFEAIKSVASAVPFDKISTNAEGTKRAHVGLGPLPAKGGGHHPLPMPQSFPKTIIGSSASSKGSSSSLASSSTRGASPNISTSTSSFHNNMRPQGFPAPQQQQQPQLHQYQSQQMPLQQHVVVSGVPNQNVTVKLPVFEETLSHAPTAMKAASNNLQFCVPANNNPIPPATSSSSVFPHEITVCRIQGCNDPVASRRPYCAKHCGNRLCERSGCTKCAQGSTRFCIAHGGGRRCTFPGCDKGARDKFFCAAHGGGKRCKFEGCSKSAVGGSSLCTAHGGGRRCAVPGCDKSAQSSTQFCVKHGGGKKCAHEGCEKVARGRTAYCAAHGGGIRCKLEGCNRVAIGKLQLCRAHGGYSSRSKKIPSQAAPRGIFAPV